MKLRRLLARLFGTLSGASLLISRKFYAPPTPKPSIREQRAAPWFKINGDKTLRLDYEGLDTDSVVFDVGGYEGQWCSDIYAKYRPTVFVFEPVQEYASEIKKRFKHNPDIHTEAFGIGGVSRTDYISLDDDQSSTLSGKSTGSQKVKLISVTEFMKDNDIKFINLMKVNIEGGEYELLDHLISSGAIKAIGNLQVQFHDFEFIHNADQRMRKIQKELSLTHTLTYQFPYIWENWRLKPTKRKLYE